MDTRYRPRGGYPPTYNLRMDPDENPDESSWLPPELEKYTEWLPAGGERREGRFLRMGGNVGGTTATLRFFGEDLDPDEITRLLGCEPTATHRKGDPVTKDGRGKRRNSGWRLESRHEEKHGIDDHVGELLSRVTNDLSVWRELACFKPDIFCGLFLSGFNQGDEVSPRISGMLAARGIVLRMDIYNASDD